jgi:AraC-like DNA-binding protein
LIDISKNELYVKSFESVFKNYLSVKTIPFCHPRYCDGLVYILGGSCKYTFAEDGRSFQAGAGDLLYLAHGAVYQMDVLEKYDFIGINFFFDSKDTRYSRVFKLKPPDKIEGMFYQALKDNNSTPLAHKVALLYRIYNELILSERIGYLPGSLRGKIDEAATTIAREIRNTPSISDLAAQADMSEVYFRKLFKSVTGISPAKFITACRITRAKELLTTGDLSLEDIAEQCGFSSIAYFCRVFKQSLGVTPIEYKNRFHL